MEDENKLVVTESAELIQADQTAINKELLKQESTALLAQLARETNLDKTADLTYLFNINHTKKAMLRQEKLDDVQDLVINTLADRVANHSDEMDNDILLKTANTIQSIMEKNATQTTTPEKPLIAVNKTDINIGTTQSVQDPILSGLSASQRKNINTFVSSLFSGQPNVAQPDAEEKPNE